MTTTVTLEQLEELGACQEHRERFSDLFPEGHVEVTVELCVRHATTFDWEWAADALLTKDAQELYRTEIGRADREYDDAVEPTLTAYTAVREPAHEVYTESIEAAFEAYWAGGSYEAHQRAIAPAKVVLEETVKDTREAHYAASRAAHKVFIAAQARAFGNAFLSEANQAVAGV